MSGNNGNGNRPQLAPGKRKEAVPDNQTGPLFETAFPQVPNRKRVEPLGNSGFLAPMPGNVLAPDNLQG